MFFIVSDKKFFMKPEYSVIQNSAMMHRYKWEIADVLSEKKIFSTVDLVITNHDRAKRFFLTDKGHFFCDKGSKVGRKISRLKFFIFEDFSYTVYTMYPTTHQLAL